MTNNQYITVNNGAIVVDGSGSTLQETGSLNLGIEGIGSLTISNGGLANITDGGDSQIGSGPFGGTQNATIIVTGNGSILDVDTLSSQLGGSGNGNGGGFTIGWGGMNVANGGLVNIQGSGGLFLALNTSVMQIGLGGVLQIDGYFDGIYGYGNLDFAGGTLQVTNSTLSTSINATLAANSNSTIDTNDLGATFSGILSGGGDLTKVGAGTLTLNATNTYTGNTTISAGTLLLANSLALQDSTLLYNTGGGTLSFGSLTAATLGGLSGNQNLALANATDGALTLTIGQNNEDTTFSGNLTSDSNGAYNLVKTGTGNLTFTGKNSYTGTTTVNSGALIMNGGTLAQSSVPVTVGGSSSGSNGSLIIENGGDFTSTGGNIGNSAGASGSVIVDGPNSIWNVGLSSLTIGKAGTGSLIISNGGYVNATVGSPLVSVGNNLGTAGNLTVTGNNSTLNVNTLGINNNSSMLVANGATVITQNPNLLGGNLTVDGANSTFTSSQSLWIASFGADGNATLTVSNGGNVSITIAGAVGTVGGATGTVLVTGANSTFTENTAGPFSINNGSLTVANGGLVALPNIALSINAPNQALNSSATVNLNSGGTLQTGNANGIAGGGALNFAGGTLQIVNAALTTTISATLVGGTTSAINTNGFNATWSGILSGSGNLTKTGTGTLALSDTNVYTGATNINGGTLAISADDNLGATPSSVTSSDLTFNGGTLNTSASFALSGNRDITLNSSGGTFDVNGTATTLTYGGIIATGTGSGAMTKLDTGTLELTGASTYKGNTTINGGTLLISGSGAAISKTNVVVVGNTSNGNLTIANGGSVTSGTSYLGYQSGSNGSVLVTDASSIWSLGSANLFVGNASTASLTIANGGEVSSGGAFFSELPGGNGTVLVTGPNSTWNAGSGDFAVGETGASASLTIANGGKVVSGPSSTGNSTVLVTGANSIWNMGTNYIEVGQLDNSTASLTIANGGNLTGQGGIIAAGVDSNATVVVDGANSIWNEDGAAGLIVGENGNGSLTISNGAKVISTANGQIGTYPGFNSTVVVEGANSTWNLGSGNLYVGESGNANLAISHGGEVTSGNGFIGTDTDGVYTAEVDGANSTWNLGAKTLYVAYTGNGALTISNGGLVSTGTLKLAGISGITSTVSIGTGGVLQVGGTNGIFANTPGYTFNWADGTVQDTGSNLTTSINATLVAAGNGSILDTQSFNATWSGVLSGDGSLTKIGAGTLTLSGANTYTGNTTVSAGTLALAGSSLLSSSNSITLAGGNLDVSALNGDFAITQSQDLAGSGNILGSATINGTMQPGNIGVAGLLSFNSSLALASSADTDFQLGGVARGSQYSAVNVAGSLSLGGTLMVNLLNNFAPAYGSTFDLFEAVNIAGAFASVILPSLNANLSWDTSQLDVNGDITTDAIDFTQWASEAGLSGANALPSAKPFTGGPANLIRYAMNLGTAVAPANLPQPTLTSIGGIPYLSIQYRLRKNMTDYTLVPQYSTDLVNWTNVTASNITQLSDADTYTAQYQAAIPLPISGTVFLRVVAQ